MIASQIALLLGLFVAPAALLVMGHKMRARSQRTRRRFWGGVAGHVAGLLITSLAMMLPPVLWGDAAAVRTVAVHWSMLAGAAVGILAGPFWPGRRAT